ncbi:hypothetical protein M3Y99_01579700 [Aphelenchoides fujianensis]|nr:hypothetical protein M3Y99_01579700 [Aphelenchoides fujianensis]
MRERWKRLGELVRERNNWGVFQGVVAGCMLRAVLTDEMDGWSVSLVALTAASSSYSATVLRSWWGLWTSLVFSAAAFLLLAVSNAAFPRWSRSIHWSFDFLDDLIAGGYVVLQVYSRPSSKSADANGRFVERTIQLATSNLWSAFPSAAYYVAHSKAGNHKHFVTVLSSLMVGIRLMEALLEMAGEQRPPEQNAHMEAEITGDRAAVCLVVEQKQPSLLCAVRSSAFEEARGKWAEVRAELFNCSAELKRRRLCAFSLLSFPLFFYGCLDGMWRPLGWEFKLNTTNARKLNIGKLDVCWPRSLGKFAAFLIAPAVRRKTSPAVVISAVMLLVIGMCGFVFFQHSHVVVRTSIKRLLTAHPVFWNPTTNSSLNATAIPPPDCVDSFTSFGYAFGVGFTLAVLLTKNAASISRLLRNDAFAIRAAVLFGMAAMNTAAAFTHHFKSSWPLDVQLLLTCGGAAITIAVFWIGSSKRFHPPVDEAAEKGAKETLKAAEKEVNEHVRHVEELQDFAAELISSE